MRHPHLFASHDDGPDGRPYLPLYRSWRGVYLTVLVCFVVYVVALTIFTRVFA